MTDLDRQLDAVFDHMPHPDPHVTELARVRALAAIGGVRRTRRLVTTGAIALAAACGGAALAAVSGLRLDRRQTDTPANRLLLPDQLRGLAVVVDGRAWVRTREGFALEGLRADAAELSPNATNLAIGIGRSLVALSPSGATAWRVATVAPVTAIRWAPNPLPIYVAYVTSSPSGQRTLGLVEADGDHPRVVTTALGKDAPAWNPDPLQLWYGDVSNVWRTYAPATGARTLTKPLIDDPPAVPPELAARALAASNHADWTATSAAVIDARTAVVAITAPPQAGSRAVELWWIGAGTAQRVFATTSRSGDAVVISARGERAVK